MKKILRYTLVFLSIQACSGDETQLLLNITSPSAFVINGESSTISVIDLASDATSTIKLNKTSGGHSSHSTNEEIHFPHHIYLSPDGTKLSIGVPGVDLTEGHTGTHETKGRILIVDAKTGQVISNTELSKPNHNSIFSPDGKELWTTSMEHDGKTLVYDVQTMTLKNSIAVGKDPAEVTFSANEKYAFIANGGSNSVSVIDIQTKKVLKTIAVGAEPVGAWTGADGNMYADNEIGQSVSIINVDKLEVIETVNLGFTPGYVAYNQALNEMWVSNAGQSFVYYFIRENNVWKKQGSIQTGLDAHAIAFSKDWKTAYVTNQKNLTVSIIDAANHKKIKDIAVGQKPNGIVLKY
ncbi:MAG: YncE family protein [Emticicia sp.]